MSALLSVYDAVGVALREYEPLMDTVTAVHDEPAPLAAALPYIEVGASTETPHDVFGRRGSEGTITLSLYSNARTRREALEAADLIDRALRGPLILDGHLAARMRREFREVLIDGSGATHVPIRYRYKTFEYE
jgi:hypothetical protein